MIQPSTEQGNWLNGGFSESAAYVNLRKFIEPDFPEEELKREIRNAYKWVDDKGKIGSKYRKI